MQGNPREESMGGRCITFFFDIKPGDFNSDCAFKLSIPAICVVYGIFDGRGKESVEKSCFAQSTLANNHQIEVSALARYNLVALVGQISDSNGGVCCRWHFVLFSIVLSLDLSLKLGFDRDCKISVLPNFNTNKIEKAALWSSLS